MAAEIDNIKQAETAAPSGLAAPRSSPHMPCPRPALPCPAAPKVIDWLLFLCSHLAPIQKLRFSLWIGLFIYLLVSYRQIGSLCACCFLWIHLSVRNDD